VHDDAKLRRFIPHAILDERAKRRPWFSQEEHVFPKIAAEAAKIVRAGGRVCIGGHGQLQGIQCHWEMWALQSGGLSNHEVLRSATLFGAQAIGFEQDLGSLEAGKMADLLVLNKDPLENIRNTNTIRFVMKNGEMWEADSLNQVVAGAEEAAGVVVVGRKSLRNRQGTSACATSSAVGEDADVVVTDLDVAASDLQAVRGAAGDVAQLAFAQFAQERGVTRQDPHIAVLAGNLRSGAALAGHQLIGSDDLE
jgi:hypothetical protein